jgi:uncharacterized membrane protein YphA (DoxX/SURF4 family)
MSSGWQVDVGLLVLRVSLAYVFIYAAWKNSENAAAWKWTVNETALLFQKFPDDWKQTAAWLCSLAGMIMMYGGGALVLLGIEPRLGGLVLALFSLLGMCIHQIRREEAHTAALAGDAMGWSAYSAHVAAGLKNWALAGAGVAVMLIGAGKYGIGADYFGSITGLAR